MRYHLGVEDMEPDHWVAYVFDLPGCFSRARTLDGALSEVPERIRAHLQWLVAHGARTELVSEPIEVELAETCRSVVLDDGYIVNAFFADDRRPLTPYDADGGLWLLENFRRDLLELIIGLRDEELRGPRRGAQSIEEILMHVAWAEWWYVDRLGNAFAREEMPLDPIVALRQVREQLASALPQWVGDVRDISRVSEHWSARKVLRRALWHERDHTEQVRSMLGAAL